MCVLFQNHKYALNPKLEHAYKMHKTICNTLLSVYESLQASFESLTRKLPSHIQMKIGEHIWLFRLMKIGVS